MHDRDSWLESMAEQPLPGGVEAAALAAAMGTALLAKAVRVTLARGSAADWQRTTLESAAAVARTARGELLRLARADEAAYRRVLDTRHVPAPDQARRQAWQTASEVPLQVAEVCDDLLRRLPALDDLCWPPVRADLEIGKSLLRAGKQAGLLAARANLEAWGSDPLAERLATRLDDLEENEQ